MGTITTTSSGLRPFLLGVGTTLAVVWLVKVQQSRRQRQRTPPPPYADHHDDDDEKKHPTISKSTASSSSSAAAPTPTNTSSTSSSATDDACWDAPDLDQRMIRKAEGAIQLRCSRITVVVERCTNDYNYSAILRTVEALGLQHVWIIEPPPPSTTTTDEGEGHEHATLEEEAEAEEGGDEKAVTDQDHEPDINNDNNDAINQKKKKKKDDVLFRSPGSGKIIKMPSKTERKDRALHHLFARKAIEWLTVREFDTTQDCIHALRQSNHVVWATDLSQQAVCLTRDALEQHYYYTDNNNNHHQQQQDTTQSSSSSSSSSSLQLIPPQLAIVFGTEAVGCSSEMLEAADLRVYLPLRGFADSLNLSVATALVLHQLFLLDPTLVGAMSETERRQLRQVWFAKLCRQRLLTPSQKRLRYKLLLKMKKAREMLDKQQQQGRHALTIEQQIKVDHLPKLEEELAKLEGKNHLIEAAIADLVDHPPQPLTDMRRADDHRVCYVGKNTKRRHETDWQDMPATTNVHTIHHATATFFRQRLKQLDQQQQEQQE